MTHKTVAIIGSGISGLSAAWLLSRNADVTLYEKAGRVGGHSNTVMADTPKGSVPVDTGFIVYNDKNYPNLKALFDRLQVPTAKSEMTFAVSVEAGRMEYSGQHLPGLFGQRRNLFRAEHWQLVRDIMRFFREAEAQAEGLDESVSIGAFLEANAYSRAFIEDHLLPISAAIWSTPTGSMLEFPARTFIDFFANHSLLQVTGRPRWRTVRGGSREYVTRMLADTRMETVLNAGIASVLRVNGRVELVFGDGHRRQFDEVVFACHANEALALIGDPTADEQRLLGSFRYNSNRAVLHTDRQFMPRRRHLWSAWNYLRTCSDNETALSLTYWMNRLQPLGTRAPIFVTLNPGHDFAPGSVQYEIDYEHPLFDAAAIAAQRQIWRIQGRNSVWFAGAWLGHGFHEDGIQSGLEVAERIGGMERPWTVPAARGRIAHNWDAEGELQWAAE